MDDLTTLTLEELEKRYRTVIADCRYYHNTDDLNNWRRETEQRETADVLADVLAAEYKRRKLTPPNIP